MASFTIATRRPPPRFNASQNPSRAAINTRCPASSQAPSLPPSAPTLLHYRKRTFLLETFDEVLLTSLISSSMASLLPGTQYWLANQLSGMYLPAQDRVRSMTHNPNLGMKRHGPDQEAKAQCIPLLAVECGESNSRSRAFDLTHQRSVGTL